MSVYFILAGPVLSGATMKNPVKILLFVIILVAFASKTFSQSMHMLDYNFGDHSGAHYWSGDYDDYSDYQSPDTNSMDVPDNPKMVTPQEFEDALATYEKYGFSYKQRKKIKKYRELKAKKERERAKPKPLKPSPDALLRLPVEVSINNKIIHPGYYLLGLSESENGRIITIKQGNKNIASIIVENYTEQKSKIRNSTAVIDNIDNDEVSITLNTRYNTYKFSLPIYKTEQKSSIQQ